MEALLYAHIPGTHQEALGCLPHRPGYKCIPSAHLGPGPVLLSTVSALYIRVTCDLWTQMGNDQRPLTVMMQETAAAEDAWHHL